MSKKITRREFVKDTGVLVVSISVVNRLPRLVASQTAPEAGSAILRSVAPEELDSWLAIAQDGKVTLYTGRVDIGTGVETSYAQIVADELDLAFEHVKVIMGDTGLTPDQSKSTASTATSMAAQPIRIAAAEARQVLLNLASKHLNTPVGELTVNEGVISLRDDSSKKISYGELIGGKRFDVKLKVLETGMWGPKLAGTAKPKVPSQYTIVGKPIPHVDIPPKVTGSYKFVHDVRVPGMLHGRVARPPALGATLLRVDPDSVRHIPGVRVVHKANFVGVVAEREEHAIRAAGELRCAWSKWSGLPDYQDLYQAVRTAPLIERRSRDEKGDVEAALQGAVRSAKATYHYPVQLHGMIGPSCAIADVKDGGATIWSGAQWVQGNRYDIAQMLGLSPEKVRVIWVAAAGCYGRLSVDDAAHDAALMSQVVGRPVRVQWMRHDEHGWEPVSTPMVMDLLAGLDARGNVVAFDFEGWSSSHSSGERGNSVAWRLLGTAPGHKRLSGGVGDHPYNFPNRRVALNYVQPLFRTLYLRAPGGLQNNFAIESFMDELAAAQGVDPIDFRLRYLEDARAVATLKAAAQKFGWDSRPSPRKGAGGSGVATGRGVSLAWQSIGEYAVGQRVAMVAEVEVHRDTGRVRVTRAVVASDCGLIINPNGLQQQVEGAVLQGISRVLMEEVKFDRSKVTSLNWNSYPILTFPETPEVEVVLINRPDIPSSGIGELATIPTGGAVANAIFDAIGLRLRQVPFTPDRVKPTLG